jgi:hypothetical protein
VPVAVPLAAHPNLGGRSPLAGGAVDQEVLRSPDGQGVLYGEPQSRTVEFHRDLDESRVSLRTSLETNEDGCRNLWKEEGDDAGTGTGT